MLMSESDLNVIPDFNNTFPNRFSFMTMFFGFKFGFHFIKDDANDSSIYTGHSDGFQLVNNSNCLVGSCFSKVYLFKDSA